MLVQKKVQGKSDTDSTCEITLFIKHPTRFSVPPFYVTSRLPVENGKTIYDTITYRNWQNKMESSPWNAGQADWFMWPLAYSSDGKASRTNLWRNCILICQASSFHDRLLDLCLQVVKIKFGQDRTSKFHCFSPAYLRTCALSKGTLYLSLGSTQFFHSFASTSLALSMFRTAVLFLLVLLTLQAVASFTLKQR